MMSRTRTRSAQHAALAVLIASAAAHAAPLFSNGSANPSDPALATGALSASGVPAPASAQWSELASDASGANALAGLSNHAGPAPVYRLADDFTVSGFAFGWSITSISFFSTLSDPAATFTALHARVWSGVPDVPGSAIVWDSAGSGAVLTPAPLALYRIFNTTALPLTAPDSTRRVWQLTLTTPGLTLASGNYWIDWQTTLSNTTASAFAPTITHLGTRGSINANARQLKPVANLPTWTTITDPGKPATSADVPQELPFLVAGSSAAPPCPGDADGNGVLNFADITAVLTNWSATYLPSTGLGDADGNGNVNFADFTSVLRDWGITCR